MSKRVLIYVLSATIYKGCLPEKGNTKLERREGH